MRFEISSTPTLPRSLHHDHHHRSLRPTWPPCLQSLPTKVPANRIGAAVRSPQKASYLAALGVQIRRADYTLGAAIQGAEKVLLISSSEVGQHLAQRRGGGVLSSYV